MSALPESDPQADAPGAPGISPTWTSSAKDAVTTGLGSSRLWVTLGHGIVNEVYWPSTGQPQIRDLGFIVAGPGGWYEVKRVRTYTMSKPKAYIPLPRIVHEDDAYRLELEILPDTIRDAFLIRFHLEGDDLRLYALLAPHLTGTGKGNSAWVGETLLAQKDGAALCLRSDVGFSRASAGYVGASDGWQDFNRNGRMTWTYSRARNGNVAMMGELAENAGVLALGFAETVEGADTLSRSTLAESWENMHRRFVAEWENWAEQLTIPEMRRDLARQVENSAAVLKTHEDRTYPGATVASLSIPWGNTHDDAGGYHLVWTRDASETGLGLLAIGMKSEACRMLTYLIATQTGDGHWSQNYYPNGRPFWTGIQLDEVGFPIVLAAKLRDCDGLAGLHGVNHMIEKAATYIVRHGPLSPQDRWEENAGASPFTLAVEISALVAAATFMRGKEKSYLLSLADYWNERIEDWTYIMGGPFAEPMGVDGYYVRIGLPPTEGGLCGRIDVRNRPNGWLPAVALVGLEFIYLARMGLRKPDDPRIRDSVKVIDKVLRVETPNGAAYRRYNEDGYGEHSDGRAFDGTGTGRAWPLLAGERGHLDVLLGKDATPYLEAMAKMTGPGGLIPEQVWDSDPIPERFLAPGKPTGSAMPLVWAHSEFIKLALAAKTGRPIERLEAVEDRYGGERPEAATWHWRHDTGFDELPVGRELLVEATAPFSLHYGFDGWQNVRDQASTPTCFGMHGVRLTPGDLRGAASLDFTFHDAEPDRWEGTNYRIDLKSKSG